jgi:uncharacterized protein (TIGR02217 family)
MPTVTIPSELPEMVVDTLRVTLLADHPLPASLVEVHTVVVQVASGAERTPLDVHTVQVLVAIRADHRYSGGYYPLANTPGSEDAQMIYYDLIFPRCIAYGSTGSPNYTTEKVEVDSGAEQRNQRRMYPRHEFNINMENLPSNEVSEIMNLWHVCAGDAIGFLFLDPMDHTSANSADALSGTDVLATDQFVSVAVGAQTDYILYKQYIAGARQVRRRIRYPDLDTLVVAVDGFPVTSWTYSYVDCLLRFNQPLPTLTASLSRDAAGVITGANFSALSPGDLIYMTGWSNGAYNAPSGGDPARVVSADGTSLVVQRFDGTAYGSAVLGPSTVNIMSALPPTGSEITAGYYFYVPVRFADGDNMESEIKSGMRESVFADFSNITLREIFE